MIWADVQKGLMCNSYTSDMLKAYEASPDSDTQEDPHKDGPPGDAGKHPEVQVQGSPRSSPTPPIRPGGPGARAGSVSAASPTTLAAGASPTGSPLGNFTNFGNVSGSTPTPGAGGPFFPAKAPNSAVSGPQRVLPVNRLGRRSKGSRPQSDSRRPRLLMEQGWMSGSTPLPAYYNANTNGASNMRQLASEESRAPSRSARQAAASPEELDMAKLASGHRSATPQILGWTSRAETPRQQCTSPSFENQPARCRYSPIPPLEAPRSIAGGRPMSPQAQAVFFGSASRPSSPQVSNFAGAANSRVGTPQYQQYQQYLGRGFRERGGDEERGLPTMSETRGGGASARGAIEAERGGARHSSAPTTSARMAATWDLATSGPRAATADSPQRPERHSAPKPRPKGPVVKAHPTRIHARLEATLQALSTNQRRTAATTRQKEVRHEAPVEMAPAVLETIKRVVCGDSGSRYDAHREGLITKMQPDKQTNYQTDELAQGARDLKVPERERIESVFKEVARSTGNIDERSKDFKWNQVTLPWSDFVKYWRGQLSAAHVQRLATYFGLHKTKLRAAVWVERIGLLVTCSPEKRQRVFFSLLDVNGDAVIGPRDVFMALSRTTEPDEKSMPPAEDDPNVKVIKAVFEHPGPFGLDFQEMEMEVDSVLAGEAAERLGVRTGDVLVRINDVRVETLSPSEVKHILQRPERPVSMVFLRNEGKKRFVDGLIPPTLFEMLLHAMTEKEPSCLSMRLRVTIGGAKGLRNADGVNGGKSDPYCVCEVEKKPHVRFQTKVVPNSLDPDWNEEHDITNYLPGDQLKFTVRDKDIGSKTDEVLGYISIPSDRFLNRHFDHEVTLQGTKGFKSTLRLKISPLGEGGIPFDEFSTLLGNHEEAPFFPALVEELTGLPAHPSGCASPRNLQLKTKVTVVGAFGVKASENPGQKRVMYCAVEVIGKSSSRRNTEALPESQDLFWKRRLNLPISRGDSMKFTLFARDAAAATTTTMTGGQGDRHHEVLGTVTVSSKQVFQGFDGMLDMGDTSKGQTPPKLHVQILVPRVEGRQEPPLSSEAAAAAAAEAGQANARRLDTDGSLALYRESELADVRKMPQGQSEGGSWYIRCFEVLCDADFRLRRATFEAAAERLFGLPSYLLAGRLFEIIDLHSTGEISLHTWVTQLDRFFGSSWEQSLQRVSLSFQIYDLDADGIVSIEDAVALAGEVERLAGIWGQPVGTGTPSICDEMRLLYGKVADATDLCGGRMLTLDLFLFNQLQPDPVIYRILRAGLDEIGKVEVARSLSPTPALTILEMVAGDWELVSGDHTFQGLRIDSEGYYQCDRTRMEPLVKAVAGPGNARKISLKRNKKNSPEYIFELDEEGNKLTGHCVQTSATWALTRKQPPQPQQPQPEQLQLPQEQEQQQPQLQQQQQQQTQAAAEGPS